MKTVNKSIIIATHYLVYGTPQALRDYLIAHKVKRLLYISHPLFIDATRSFAELLQNGRIIDTMQSKTRFRVTFLNYIFEMYLTLKWFFKKRAIYEAYFGVDPLNTLPGLLLRSIGQVKKVIYYTIDFAPNRFDNKVLNTIYHKIDAFCLKHADETWNVSPRIAEGREKLKGLKHTVYNRQKIVPIGIWYDKVKRLPFNKVKKHQLFYLGHLMESAGVQLVLDAVPEIVKKIPDFHFLIVGGGEYEEALRKKAKVMHLEKSVTFTGWVKNRKKLDTIMADSALAIAPYDKRLSKTTGYSDPTKLKDYLSAGLPIILTDLPHNAQDIAKNHCGVVIEYDIKAVIKAVTELLSDEKKLQLYRENALKYAQKFDWNRIYEKYF